MDGCRSGKQTINGFAFDTVRLALIYMGKDNGLKDALLDPTAHCRVIDTQNARNFGDG